jgi:hypothetical protein
MQPGDALYIPRGLCHDALAQSDFSMHVTYAIAPHSGRVLLRMLEAMALEDPAFRAHLPDGAAAAPGALKAHLADLARRLHDLVASDRVEEELRTAQLALRVKRPSYDLPHRKTVVLYRNTGRPIEISGDTARIGGVDVRLNGAGKAAAWVARRPAFTDGELRARFQTVPAAALDHLIAELVRLGAATRV